MNNQSTVCTVCTVHKHVACHSCKLLEKLENVLEFNFGKGVGTLIYNVALKSMNFSVSMNVNVE